MGTKRWPVMNKPALDRISQLSQVVVLLKRNGYKESGAKAHALLENELDYWTGEEVTK